MSVAITESGLTSSPSEKFSELERLLDVQLKSINLKNINSEIDYIRKNINTTAGSKQIGIVFPVANTQSTLKKIQSLLFTASKARSTSKKLAKVTGESYVSYGVYPDITHPVAIYELDSPAEEYANKYFLPPINSGLNGFLRRIIFSIIKFHPSTAGIVLINTDDIH